MNIIEKEASEFNFFEGTYPSSIEELQDRLNTKLSIFKRKKDKLHFLNTLRKKVLNKKQVYEKTNGKVDNDYFIREMESGLFLIDQKIEVISRSYEYQPKYDDEFSSEQKSELNNSINEIKDKLNKQGFGQEVIFNELEELKEHLNLGKKNWFQLLKGKLIDSTVSQVVDKTVIEGVYKKLAEGFENLPELIDKI